MSLTVLGIETSCDETAAAVVDGAAAPAARLLSNIVLSQTDAHAPFAGVVPEIAARAHLDHVGAVTRQALAAAGRDLAGIDAVAATGGPGLIGGVIVGCSFAKALALAAGKPFVAVNHLEAHALTVRLAADVPFPFLLLLVSGGHSQILDVRGVGDYRQLGTTRDDAIGEAFDKAAKLMGLGMPGGPAIERCAAMGDPTRFALPRPMFGRPDCDFSLSGLKTAVRLTLEKLPPGPFATQDLADLAAALQLAIADIVEDRLRRAMGRVPDTRQLVAAGGVAANLVLRARLDRLCADQGWAPLAVPPVRLCTDNGAMVAWAGVERLRLGLVDQLDFAPRPRWPLEDLRAGARA